MSVFPWMSGGTGGVCQSDGNGVYPRVLEYGDTITLFDTYNSGFVTKSGWYFDTTTAGATQAVQFTVDSATSDPYSKRGQAVLTGDLIYLAVNDATDINGYTPVDTSAGGCGQVPSTTQSTQTGAIDKMVYMFVDTQSDKTQKTILYGDTVYLENNKEGSKVHSLGGQVCKGNYRFGSGLGSNVPFRILSCTGTQPTAQIESCCSPYDVSCPKCCSDATTCPTGDGTQSVCPNGCFPKLNTDNGACCYTCDSVTCDAPSSCSNNAPLNDETCAQSGMCKNGVCVNGCKTPACDSVTGRWDCNTCTSSSTWEKYLPVILIVVAGLVLAYFIFF